MTIDNGLVRLETYTPSHDDLKLLKQAEKLNSEISRQSIVYVSQNFDFSNFIINPNRKNVTLYSKNQQLIEIFKKENIIHNNLNSVIEMQSLIFIDASSYTLKELHQILQSIPNNGNKILLLITGNPFPYIQNVNNYPLLMSFSDTVESVQQLALCLKGVFKPKLSHPCFKKFKP